MAFRIVIAIAILVSGLLQVSRDLSVIRAARRDGRMLGGALPGFGARPIYLRDEPQRFHFAVKGRIIFVCLFSATILYGALQTFAG